MFPFDFFHWKCFPSENKWNRSSACRRALHTLSGMKDNFIIVVNLNLMRSASNRSFDINLIHLDCDARSTLVNLHKTVNLDNKLHLLAGIRYLEEKRNDIRRLKFISVSNIHAGYVKTMSEKRVDCVNGDGNQWGVAWGSKSMLGDLSNEW